MTPYPDDERETMLQHKTREIKINLMAFVWVGFGIYCVSIGTINWWMLALVMLSHIEFPIVKRW